MAASSPNPHLIPAMKAPAGLQSNLVNPPSQKYPTIILIALVLVLSTPFVLLRMYTRKSITRQLWWDDWSCVLGWVFMVALAGLLLKSLDYGGGTDLWNVSKAEYANFTRLFHDIEIVARVGMFFTKVSIVLLYQRLFIPPGHSRTAIWWSIWFVFWWNLLYALALVLTVATECANKAEKVAKGEECLDQYAVLICASVINVVSDLMILIIPIAAIWGLHMSLEKKIRLSAVFALGSLGVMASVARLGYQIPEANKPNQTIVVIILSLLNIAEQMIGIIVGCMPALPSFFRHISSHSSEPQPSEPNGNNTKRNFIGSFSGYQTANKGFRTASEDPYPFHSHSGYEELEELEGQRKEGDFDARAITKTTTICVGNQ